MYFFVREPLWGKILIKFSHLLLTTSSAINILIYSYKVKKIGTFVNFEFTRWRSSHGVVISYFCRKDKHFYLVKDSILLVCFLSKANLIHRESTTNWIEEKSTRKPDKHQKLQIRLISLKIKLFDIVFPFSIKCLLRIWLQTIFKWKVE